MSKVFHRKMYRNIVNVYICIPSLLPLPKLIPGIVHKGYMIIFKLFITCLILFCKAVLGNKWDQ